MRIWSLKIAQRWQIPNKLIIFVHEVDGVDLCIVGIGQKLLVRQLITHRV